MEINFEIKSRGSMLISYGNRNALISGELTFEPPVFYADLNSFKNWNPPFDNETISEDEKKKIINYIMSINSPTKIVFE
ncbi:MAG: Imm74 family immunity protein [Bacteroidia bacterium]